MIKIDAKTLVTVNSVREANDRLMARAAGKSQPTSSTNSVGGPFARSDVVAASQKAMQAFHLKTK